MVDDPPPPQYDSDVPYYSGGAAAPAAGEPHPARTGYSGYTGRHPHPPGLTEHKMEEAQAPAIAAVEALDHGKASKSRLKGLSGSAGKWNSR